jgi:hypothetical protein
MDSKEALVVFEGTKIRRTWHDEQWYFSVVDIIQVLTDSGSPRQYWGVLKSRETQLLTICLQLKLPSSDGKYYNTDCVNTENAFRLIQSIPSKKAEPFKRWLAKVGYERVQEIEDPELAQKRMKEIYKLKGYSDDWIEKRVRGIAIRDELTDEWDKRGIKTNSDHMNDLELIFTMLGEASTTKIARNKDAIGFDENKDAAKEGGTVAGIAREELEKRSGEKVVSKENYLIEPEIKKKLESKNKSKQEALDI